MVGNHGLGEGEGDWERVMGKIGGQVGSNQIMEGLVCYRKVSLSLTVDE